MAANNAYYCITQPKNKGASNLTIRQFFPQPFIELECLKCEIDK